MQAKHLLGVKANFECMFLQIPRAVKDSYSTTSPPPPDPLGGDHRTGPRQRTGAVGEEGPAHPDDTHGGELQPSVMLYENRIPLGGEIAMYLECCYQVLLMYMCAL